MDKKNKNQKPKYKREQINFLEKEKLEKYLICPICQEIFDEPIRITCGHTFCNICIAKWEKKSRNNQCPLCREIYEPYYSGKDLLAQNMINDALVTCIYKGCPWKDRLAELNNHIQNCLFNPKKLQKFSKITNWFKENNKTESKQKNKENEEEEDEPIDNICSFNYTSNIKERIFSRNPTLVQKLFCQEDKKEDKINVEEKISDNDEINEIYNYLIFDEKKDKEKNNINIINDENKSENEKNLQSSSIMNIFINPNITINSKDFLGNKIERNGK